MTTRPVFRLLFSLSLLLAVIAFSDLDAVQQQFVALGNDRKNGSAAAWIVLAIFATFPQYLLSARRWQLTAAQLDLNLPYGAALKAYYKATFFNQVLPGGVLGDVARAVEHGRHGSPDQRFSAWRAVAIERLAGQLVLIAAVCLAPPFVGFTGETASTSATSTGWWSVMAALALITLIVAAYNAAPRLAFVTKISAGLQTFTADLARAWLRPGLPVRQLALSLAVLVSYVLSYIALALAFGFDGDLLWLSSVILLVLLSMSLPLSVAGWGVREVSAAGLWLAGGQDPSAGVAIAVAYGLLNLGCSLPGLWFILRRRGMS
ncbi:lysylphosphatidylglycerol synthase transmembrane domain-containing protein [Allohahella marinimesophila]|uniref:Lysylphosphatidylglycerol synthase transmembrane domain-containing protein n=1 Tax=Allohahella marinimesophila TaxID=1054972 RepID=A0ABP7NLZ8_9GAMM